MNKTYTFLLLLLIASTSFFMHYSHFSKDLMSFHVWRQTQTQSTIINFYEEDMNIFNPRRNERGNGEGIFRMEFPLMQWMIAATYKMLGKDIIITRVFMFIISLFSVFGMFKLLEHLFRKTTLSIIGAWAISFSPAFFYYAINPLPDSMALCCSIWGLSFFFGWYNKPKNSKLILSGVFISIATLCKLPFIVFSIIPLTYFMDAFVSQKNIKSLLLKFVYHFVWLIVPVLWYVIVIPDWGANVIIKGMLNNEESFIRILDLMQHNLISTLPELLVNYGAMLFFLAGFYFLLKRKAYKDKRFKLFLISSIGVLLYFFFEINAIGKMHDYYLFPFLPLIFILVAYGGYHLLITPNLLIRILTILLIIILPITCYLRLQTRWNPESPGFNKDLLVYKDDLRNAVPKDALVVAGNDKSHFIFFYYIDKKGWGFHNDDLTPEKLKNMIASGAQYLYSDSDALNNNAGISEQLDSLLMCKGSIYVYSLKPSKGN